MNNDLISRSDLKEAIETYDKFACLTDTRLVPFRRISGHEEDYEPYVKLRDIRNAIDNTSPVEPEITEKQAILTIINTGWLVNHDKELREKWQRPQGEWIKVTKAGTVPVEYICSLCRRKIYDNYELTTPIDEFYPFCHCGAEMRGEKNDSNNNT